MSSTRAFLKAMRRIAGVGVWVVVVACDGSTVRDGGDEDLDGDVASALLTPQDFYDENARASCERSERCGGAIDQTVDECVARYEAGAEPRRTRFIDAIAGGSVSYDEGRAAQCIQLYASDCSVDELLEILPVCNGVTAGTLAVGAACFAHVQCNESFGAAGRCFAGCAGLFGSEDPQREGTCVQRSPFATGECP